MGKDKLIEVLESMGYVEGETIFLQGSYPANTPYPDSFFTFWNTEVPEDLFYDNEPSIAYWHIQLNFYSNDPMLVNTELERAKPLLKAAGFVMEGKGGDLESDFPAWTGRGCDLIFVEKYKKEKEKN